MIIFIFIFLVQVISADFTDTEECNRYLDENIEGIKNLVTHTLFRRKSRGCVPLVYLTESGFDEKRECVMKDILFTSNCQCDFDILVGGTSVFDDEGSNAWIVKSVVTETGMDKCFDTIDVVDGKRGYTKKYVCRIGALMFMHAKCECSFVVDSEDECEFANAFFIPHINISVNIPECPYEPAKIIGYRPSFHWPAPFIDPFVYPFVDDEPEDETEDESEEDESEEDEEED